MTIARQSSITVTAFVRHPANRLLDFSETSPALAVSRPPGPEPDDASYLLDYTVHIVTKNFILSTKSTLVGGQLGGHFSCAPAWLSRFRTVH